MVNPKIILSLFFLTLLLKAQAPSLPESFDHFVKSGVPSRALVDSLSYLQKNPDQVKNQNFVGIIDYSLTSLEKRFWILNLKAGTYHRIWVSHGVSTGGGLRAYRFSNQVDSLQTSLGFFLVGSGYFGVFKESFQLHGLQRSNSKAFDRKIVLHAAPYVSHEFISKHKRLGRSHGCFAISQEDLPLVKKYLPRGSLIYSYFEPLMDQAQNTASEIGWPLNPADDNPPWLTIERSQRP